jgi:acetoin utilization deacetylase AcuC-like enzyme
MAVSLYFDDKMIEHDPGPRHPERPDRLRSIWERLQSAALPEVSWKQPDPIERQYLERIHSSSYVDRLLELDGESARLDPDTAVSPDSIDAAMLAAGGLRDAVDDVCGGEADRAFALVRPPGHHAERSEATGFCLFNNVAVAAEYALEERPDIERVAIVDWDVHHGNGTQTAFQGRDDVLFVSSHQHPFYPGTGPVAETGSGEGQGYTVNAALPAGMGDGDYEAVFSDVVEPIVENYNPDLLLVSAGFDAHERDPLANMNVTTGQFARLCHRLQQIARSADDGNMVLTLEGGYDLQGLADSVERCTRVLAGADAPEPPGEASRRGLEAIQEVVHHHDQYWPLSI